MTSLNEASVAELAARFSGVLLSPGATDYEDARRVHNGIIDRRPGLIARCLGTADIVDAVNFARTRSIELAVRGGRQRVPTRMLTSFFISPGLVGRGV